MGGRFFLSSQTTVVSKGLTVRATISSHNADRKAVNLWARESERAARITAMIHLAESEDIIPVWA